MKLAYFNCRSGIAGDMILASFIDAGITRPLLERKLKRSLRVTGWSLSSVPAARHHFPAKLVTVRGDKRFDSPEHMKRIIRKSSLPARIADTSLRIIDELVRAEARVHRVPPNQVHFHELNSLDTLIDVTGSCLALGLAGIDTVTASPLNLGRPAPATVEILRHNKVPVYSTDSQNELTTPTGAAVISTVAQEFGPMPPLTVEKAGYGAGTLDTKDRPNLLTVLIGPAAGGGIVPAYDHDETVMLETNIDDMDPRIYPYVMEKLLAHGAKDAWLTQVLMKKGRPGIILSALCAREAEEEIARIIFEETTTLGIRRIPCQRHILKRSLLPDRKIAYLGGKKMKVKSEFRHARSKAVTTSRPLKTILY